MCGIVGGVSPAGADPELVERMSSRVAHRGPDAEGVWASGDGRVVLGHRRLAVVDLDPHANQPFLSGDGSLALTFNGEIYNFRELRAELESLGSRFRTRSDTEVLLEAYRSWGERCLERISGMFAFAIWDEQRERLFCARDRAGEKPFYYAVCGEAFYFASELKSLLLCPGFRRELDHGALAQFLVFGFVPDPRTIWQGARKLPPAHSLTIELRGGEVQVGRPRAYWDLELAPDETVDDWGPQIRGALEQAAAEMAYADVPVGSFLSGGIDSSSVTAALSRAGCDVRTFTVGFDEAGYDERPFAREVATLYRTRHLESVLHPSDAELLFRETLLRHFDEPFADYSYLPTFLVCREARRSITVALTGDGGDEIFGGYRKYTLLARRQVLERRLTAPGVRLVAAGARAVAPGTARRSRLLRYRQTAGALLLHTLTTGIPVPALRLIARGPLADALEQADPAEVVNRHLDRAPPREVGLVNAMRYLDLKLTLGAGILTKLDRSSMAVSLETRPVYTNRGLLDLAGRVPPGLLADRAVPKRVLREALRPWLPPSVLERRKQGFAAPLGRWLRSDLRSLPADIGRDGALAELLHPGYAADVVAAHRSGGARTAELHNLFFLHHWLQRWT